MDQMHPKEALCFKEATTQKKQQSQLNLKIYQYGIIRLHGRFVNADLPEDAEQPILLSRQEHFSKLLTQDIHHKIHYCGVSKMLA